MDRVDLPYEEIEATVGFLLRGSILWTKQFIFSHYNDNVLLDVG